MADTSSPAVAFQNADASKLTILNRSTGSESNDNPGGEGLGASSDEGVKTEEGKPANQSPTQGAKTTGANTDEDEGGEGNEVTPKEGEGKEGEGKEGEGAADGEYTEEQFTSDVNTLISNSTGGKIKDISQINNILSEYNTLKANFDKKEPTFPNAEAKAVYNLATKAVGLEVKTAKQLFHILSLPELSTMTPKEKQFEAFCLDRPNLSREDASKRFEALYEKSYNDLENDLLQTDAHDQATAQSEAKIQAKLTELEQTVKQSGDANKQGPSQADIDEMNAGLERALSEFGGVSLKFDDSQYGKLDVPMEQGKAQEFMEVLKNPYALIDRIADNHRDASGKLNLNDFVREMYLLFDRDRISKVERDHLMKLGKVAQMKVNKNNGKTDKTEQSTTAPKTSFKDSFAGAVKAAGMAN